MNQIGRILKLLLMLLCSVALNCTLDLSGNTTQTGNPAVLAGTIFHKDGKTPAADATVRIHVRLQNDQSSDLDSTIIVSTDGQGSFSIDYLKSGLYAIESEKSSYKSFKDSVLIPNAGQTVHFTDTLLPTGTIQGVIELPEGGDPRKVMIILLGINRVFTPDSNGVFVMEALAHAKYDVRFLPILNDYEVVDMSGISVESYQITDLGSVALPYSGIPSVKELSVTCDTLLQIVTLHWRKSDSENVSNYRVYRKAPWESSASLISSQPLSDTVFIDTSLMEGSFQYRVVPVDLNGNEGPFRDGVTVRVGTAFKEVGSYGNDTLFSRIRDIRVLPDGRIICLDMLQSKVTIISVYGEVSQSWGVTGSNPGELNMPFCMSVDDSLNVYILEYDGRLQKFNIEGKLQKVLQTVSMATSMEYAKDRIFFQKADSIYVFNLNTEELSSLNIQISNMLRMSYSESSLFILTEQPAVINEFTLGGELIHIWSPSYEGPWFSTAYGITVIDDQTAIISSEQHGAVYAIGRTGRTIARTTYYRNQNGNQIAPEARRKVYCFDKSNNSILLADHHYIYRYSLLLP